MLEGATSGWMISIHAPAQGATFAPFLIFHVRRFQFTLPHRERPAGEQHYFVPAYFNSRSRTGSDADARYALVSEMPISIHAPAQGATLIVFRIEFNIQNFNSRSRTGSDRRQ